MSDVTHLPQTGVVLDLDSETRPSSESDRPPYSVNVSGKVVTLIDPDEIDWQLLAEVRIPSDLLRLSMTREDFDHLIGQKLPTWKFKRLLDQYYKHYDVEEKVRAAKRQAQMAGF